MGEIKFENQILRRGSGGEAQAPDLFDITFRVLRVPPNKPPPTLRASEVSEIHLQNRMVKPRYWSLNSGYEHKLINLNAMLNMKTVLFFCIVEPKLEKYFSTR